MSVPPKDSETPEPSHGRREAIESADVPVFPYPPGHSTRSIGELSLEDLLNPSVPDLGCPPVCDL